MLKNILSLKTTKKLLFFVFIFPSLAWSDIGGLTCIRLPELMRAYLVAHVTKKQLDDAVKKEAIKQYLETLDPSKTQLLASDIAIAEKELMAFFEEMTQGNCGALDRLQKILLTRAVEAEQFTKASLNNPKYKIDEKAEIITDPKKRAYPKTIAEKEGLLLSFIHFQMANYLATDTKFPEAKKQLIHRYELVTKRVRERTNSDLINTFADSFSSALDPHSSYFSKDALEDFRISMGLSLEGIGASLSSEDGYTIVQEVIPGGAADKAKTLKSKDKIVSVAQDKGDFVSVIDMDLKEVVKLIRGKKGTRVRLNILRQSGESTDRVEIAIVRDKVDLKEQAAKLQIEEIKRGDKSFKLAVIELPSFYGDSDRNKRSSLADIRKLLSEAQEKKADGVLLNLSRNGGGLLDDGYKMAGLFLRTGPIVATRDARNRVDILADKDETVAFSGPLVVLTSRLSASASEILAGALRDYKRAVIVGADRTFGKGTVQTVLPLPGELGAMKVTNGMFFLPGGQSTQHQGVAGDVIIPSPLNFEEIGEDKIDGSLPTQKIASFKGTEANYDKGPMAWTEVRDDWVSKIKSASQVRVSKNEKFKEILSEIEEAKKNEGKIKVADLLKKDVEKDKKRKEAEKKTFAERTKDADAPVVGEAVQILADLIALQKGISPTAEVEKAL